MSRTRSSRLVVVLSVLMLSAACGSEPTEPESSAASPAGPRPSSTATLTITEPGQGAVVKGSSADLVVEIEGGEISDQTSTDLQPDQGHLHVILDDHLVDMTGDTTSTLRDLTPGLHLVKVEFVANDHAPFDPRVIAAASFEVKK